jgi:fucose permease
MLGSIISPAFIKKFGMKTMLIVGAMIFTLVVIAQILPAEYDYYLTNPDG